MKAKIVYSAVFGGAFIMVTLMIILMNSVFNNIFRFDFSPPQSNLQQNLQISQAGFVIDSTAIHQVKKEFLDSLRRYRSYFQSDSNYLEVKLDSTIYDSLKSLQVKLGNLEKMNQKKIDTLGNKKRVSDSLAAAMDAKKLEEWAKQTAKLYESMDARKAAKIISSYSDNESREILFRMNKKKAAKILAELNPETARRITRAL